jgi:hypothetical protein
MTLAEIEAVQVPDGDAETAALLDYDRAVRESLQDPAAVAALQAQVAINTANATLTAAAMDYALGGWKVFPLNGKAPAIKGGRGVKDATDDLRQVLGWWGGRYAGCGIGLAIPLGVMVIDVDRHGREDGVATMQKLVAQHGERPDTMTHITGTGFHLFYLRPPGRLSAKHLPGIDLKITGGYVVAPPSIHPGTGEPYQKHSGTAEIIDPPAWLTEALRTTKARTH